MSDIITLAHGSGGKLTHKLISDLFQRYFKNDLLLESGDSAVFEVEGGKMAFTTDSYVVSPIFFKGGNIGKLAVCGTVNDLAVSGAIPKYISCGFIIEEGFTMDELEKIVQSMAEAAKEAGVSIVTGDTKVVQKGAADRLFINTSGIGVIPQGISISTKRLKLNDKIIISGTIGDHGTTILLEREKLQIWSDAASDCAPLNGMIEAVTRELNDSVHIMRDPTRGGLGTTLNELVAGSPMSIKLNEESLPVREDVRGVCEMLGMDPMYMANEGKVIFVVDGNYADRAIELLRQHPYGRNAAIIGEVADKFPGKVFMNTITGGSRIIDMLVGDQLPRIC